MVSNMEAPVKNPFSFRNAVIFTGLQGAWTFYNTLRIPRTLARTTWALPFTAKSRLRSLYIVTFSHLPWIRTATLFVSVFEASASAWGIELSLVVALQVLVAGGGQSGVCTLVGHPPTRLIAACDVLWLSTLRLFFLWGPYVFESFTWDLLGRCTTKPPSSSKLYTRKVVSLSGGDIEVWAVQKWQMHSSLDKEII